MLISFSCVSVANLLQVLIYSLCMRCMKAFTVIDTAVCVSLLLHSYTFSVLSCFSYFLSPQFKIASVRPICLSTFHAISSHALRSAPLPPELFYRRRNQVSHSSDATQPNSQVFLISIRRAHLYTSWGGGTAMLMYAFTKKCHLSITVI